MKRRLMLMCWILVNTYTAQTVQAEDGAVVIEIDADEFEDKLRGGMLGQVLGNLNGLPHEFKYIAEPGNVEQYTPSLPDGARTDDDTDIEWVYLRAIAESGESQLPPPRLTQLWKRHINRRIFCANRYARQLMELGFEPPWTGHPELNPWAEFNIAGQFLCESFGMMAPAMPQTAARLGVHYTTVAIDGEPAQATQLFTAMLATAYVEADLERILDAGAAAVDPDSNVAGIVRDVRAICRAHPNDWRATRAEIQQRWQTHGGTFRDSNGYELNTACTVAALLHGDGDFAETLRLAFNLGWDCDNNAATAGAILGVVKGRRWMNDQGWDIADVYRNTTRDEMPDDETLTGLEDRLFECARIVIEEQGGRFDNRDGRSVVRIRRERPANIEPLSTREERLAGLRDAFLPALEKELVAPKPINARAAYLAICLNEADRFERESPGAWSSALRELKNSSGLLREVFNAPGTAAESLQQRAHQAGLQPPAR